MKKLIALALALMLALTVAAVAESADLLSQIRERGTLIIGTEGNWAPWTYHDENDVLTGFDIEIGSLHPLDLFHILLKECGNRNIVNIEFVF